MDGIEQAEEGALRVGAGDYGFGADLFAAGEQHTCDFSILHQNLSDFGVGANFCACFFCGGGHGIREGAHASAGVSGVPYRIRIGGGAQQKQERGAGGPGAESCSIDAAGGDGGAEQIGFEKFSDEIRGGHGAPADQAHHFFFAEAADFAADLQKFPDVFFGGLFDYGRREFHELRGDVGDASRGWH